MIPKTIHYCWFGGNPLPELTLKCIASWRKYLPEYNIIEWNESNYDVNKNIFTKEAYINKKYAFVSDFCRLEILFLFGGIYLDTDMELIKTFVNRENQLVLGFEDINYVAAGIIMCKKNEQFIYQLMNFYKNKSYNENINNLSEITIPKLITTELKKKGLILNNNYQLIENNISIYPSEFFYPLNFFTGKTVITKNSVAIHHYESSWMSNKDIKLNKLKVLLIRIFGLELIDNLKRLIKKQ